MRKVIVSNLVTLDGFFEGSNNEIDWHVVDEEFFAYAKEMLREADTLLFGATTYKMMAAYWPTAEADEIAEKMNRLAKVVFSTTLKTAEWNNSRLVRNNIREEVLRLKQQPGKDLVVLGARSWRPICCKLG